MRVLFVTRPNLLQHPGGDTTQIVETARSLRGLGVDVELADHVPDRLDGFSVVHLFHLDRLWENVPHLRKVRRRVPIALSPIWWPKDDYNAHSRQGAQGVVARAVGTHAFDVLRLVPRSLISFREQPSLATFPRPSAWAFERRAQELLRTASVVLPNSAAEARQLQAHFGTSFEHRVVPNGVRIDRFSTLGGDEAAGSPSWDVLCVARFEPRKNQHKLIEAFRGTEVRVGFVGTAGQFTQTYEAACRQAATPNIEFLGRVEHDALPSVYRGARVHALPSWFETPGLSSLEAALAGCGVVVAECDPVREYFGGLVTYCDPLDVRSIRAAVETALHSPVDRRLQRHVAERYSWEEAARATLDAYRSIVPSGRRARYRATSTPATTGTNALPVPQ